MIIPSIDIMDGRAVQLVGGETLEIDAGDPWLIAERFSRVGEIAVIDLDAAKGVGSNAELIRALVRAYPCRVGGGIRDAETAISWLDAGAERVILGTAARAEVLERLPRDRVIAALDARDGEVVVEGWGKRTGQRVEDRIEALRAHVGGFLITLVELEGRMGGIPIDRVEQLASRCANARLTIAGGVRDADEIGAIDRLGADAQVGMALYSGRFDLSEAIWSMSTTDRPDGLVPTVVCDESGIALGLAYSNQISLAQSLQTGRAVYWSRSRNELWRKGASSGATQGLLGVAMDCDRDTIRFTVRQDPPGFCHTGSRTCFGADRGLGRLARRIGDAVHTPDAGSYSARLVRDPELLAFKLREEAGELASASTASDVTHEAADLLYFTLVSAANAGVSLSEIESELDRRERRVRRRSQTRGEKSKQELERTP